jgi:L-ascorbate metabolism protein UlaG (beta-lactamase superfamily)
MSLIPAHKKDEALLQEMDALLQDPTQCHLWWLGQSGFLVQYQGCRLLIDPYLSDSLTHKYATTDKPHVRMSERVIAPEWLRGVSLVSSSHNHTDHLDADTLIPVLKNNPDAVFLIPEANRAFVAERAKCPVDFPVGLNDRNTNAPSVFTLPVQAPLPRIKVHGIPAKHNEMDRDAKGNCLYMGYVFEIGPYKIYHSGDTLWFDEMLDLLSPFKVDLAILPINGNDPARRVAGNLDVQEAAQLGKAIGAACVIPCHYDMFEFNTASVADFVSAADQIGQAHKVLKGGERHSIG